MNAHGVPFQLLSVAGREAGISTVMYNFGRVPGHIGLEWYCDSSEMGMAWGDFDAFPSNFITPVRGNDVRKSRQNSAQSAGTLFLAKFGTNRPPYHLSPILLPHPWASVMTVISGWHRKRNGRVTAPMPRLT